MITVRPAEDRGRFDFGWLDTAHTFSFGEYRDPRHMGFGSLRVINEDRVAPSRGFGTHPHRDMEILSFVLAGRLEHRDSLGGHGVIGPGEVQRITAGRGVMHSEFNPSASEQVHFLQVWIKPRALGLEPSYEQRSFAGVGDGLTLVASLDGRDGSIVINQDALVLLGKLGEGGAASHPLGEGRRAWVQVMRGQVILNGTRLDAGDGAAVTDETDLRFEAGARGEFLLFDMGSA